MTTAPSQAGTPAHLHLRIAIQTALRMADEAELHSCVVKLADALDDAGGPVGQAPALPAWLRAKRRSG
ncbi:hypothetical protein [Caenispirillum bisanense]|uniref:hypothetical protein n=1 Tax=Caenispirillum bisanense TaxID=414052 RepID=UPI0031D7144F